MGPTSQAAPPAAMSQPEPPQPQDAAEVTASPYLTPESKEKGDAGIYAALDAMQLSRALHGVTGSRLDQQHQQQAAATAARGMTAAMADDGSAAGGGAAGQNPNALRLGMEPVECRSGAAAEVQAMYHAAVVEAVATACGAEAAAAVARGVAGASGTTTAVGLPDEVATLRRVLPIVHEVKPNGPMNFDALQRLFALMEEAVTAGSASVAATAGVTSLLLANGVVDPARQPAPSTTAWEAKYREVFSRYPLPVAKSADSIRGSQQGDADEDDDDDGQAAEVDTQNNAALQERCATLGITYDNHANAVRDVAFFEMRVFPLLCAYLSKLNARTGGGRDAPSTAAIACAQVKVLDLSYNQLGAPVVMATPGDDEAAAAAAADAAPVRQLAPLRALAAMLDANESLRYLNLRGNALGPRGVGIVAKALTKNVALCGVDLSANALNVAAETEEVEDPLYEPEDPVFGESYEGLEAVAEVLKKNKFLRVLRLAQNGLHAGEDLTAPPPAEETDEVEEAAAAGGDGGDGRAVVTFAAAQERWTGVPLWTLLSPLYRYQRLSALDLSKNSLGNDGVHMLAVALSGNTSLEVLDLTDNAIGYAGLAHLARYVLRRPAAPSGAGTVVTAPPPPSALHTLILRQNPLGCIGGAADAVAGIDARRRRLTKRQLKRATAAVQSFAMALGGPRGVRRLVLANAYLGPAFSSLLLRSLARAEELTELDFSFNHACGDHPTNFDITAAHNLAAVLYQPERLTPPHLERLCFDGNNLTAAGVAALLPTAPATTLPASLTELTLSRNSIGDNLGSLAQLLGAGATTLACLDISYNGIYSMSALLPGLVAATALTELNVSHNALGVQEGLLRDITAAQQEMEVVQLFQCLAQMPKLALLDMGDNDWRVAHMEQLSAFFADPAMAVALRKLDIRNTPRVPPAQLMTLLQYVASRPSMEVFIASVVPEKPPADASVSWTFDAVMQVICGVVGKSSSLLEVDCGLLRGDAGGALDADDTATAADAETLAISAAAVSEVRERLLLNALMKASGTPVAA